MIGASADIAAFCVSPDTDYVDITYSASEGGIIDRWVEDGVLFVKPEAEEGYAFDGYYLDGERIDSEKFEFDGQCDLEVRFVKK